MVMEFLRTNKWVMYTITILRIWLGYAWFLSGFNKVIHGFSAHKFINMAIKNPVQGMHGEQFPWFTVFLKICTNNGSQTEIFSMLVPWAEILIGFGLIFGLFNLAAAFLGLIMNFTFIFAGTISSNPNYIIIEFLILVIGNNSSKLGLDNLVIPWLKNKFLNKRKTYQPYEPHF